MSSRRSLLLAGLVAAAALALDQVTKALARSAIEPGEQIDLILGTHLVRVGNEGIAFGLLEGLSTGVLVAIGIAFTIGLAAFLVTSEDRPLAWLPIGLLAGGALGNLVDRIRLGEVTDFIDPPSWPAFNVADVEITLGVLALVFLFLREPDPEAKR